MTINLRTLFGYEIWGFFFVHEIILKILIKSVSKNSKDFPTNDCDHKKKKN